MAACCGFLSHSSTLLLDMLQYYVHMLAIALQLKIFCIYGQASIVIYLIFMRRMFFIAA